VLDAQPSSDDQLQSANLRREAVRALKLLDLLIAQVQPRGAGHEASDSWVLRRIEHVELMDSYTIRRRISIDFAVPEQIEGVGMSGLPYLPVAWLRRDRTLRDFDLRDESGCRVPVATRREGEQLARIGLQNYAFGIVAQASRDNGRLVPASLVTAVAGDLATIAVNPKRTEREAALERFREAAREPFRPYALAGDDERFQRRVVQKYAPDGQDLGLGTVLSELVERFALLAMLPDAASAPGGLHARRALTMSWIDGTGGRPKFRHWLPTRMAWTPIPLRLRAWPVEWTQSYHIEMASPSGDLQIQSVGDVWQAVDDTDPVHLGFALGALSKLDAQTDLRPSVTVALTATRGGLLRAAFFACLLSTALLAFGWWRRDELLIDVEAAVTLLVFVPGLLTVYAIREGEHGLATQLLSGVRCMVITVALCVLCVALLLIVDVDPVWREALWLGLVVIATAATLAVTWSNFGPQRFRLPRKGKSSTTRASAARTTDTGSQLGRFDPRPVYAFGLYVALVATCLGATLLAYRDELGIERRLQTEIAEAGDRDRAGDRRVRLASFAKVSWTRLFVFGPNTSQAQVARAVGANRVAAGRDHGQTLPRVVEPSVSLLVLVDRHAIVEIVTLKRKAVDLAEAEHPDQCYLEPSDALAVRLATSSSYRLRVSSPEAC